MLIRFSHYRTYASDAFCTKTNYQPSPLLRCCPCPFIQILYRFYPDFLETHFIQFYSDFIQIWKKDMNGPTCSNTPGLLNVCIQDVTPKSTLRDLGANYIPMWFWVVDGAWKKRKILISFFIAFLIFLIVRILVRQ